VPNTRLLPFDGLHNARDLGGLLTNDGKSTRFGVFIRSEVPSHLTAADLEMLKQLQVDTRIDLRDPNESKVYPGISDDSITEYSFPLLGDRARSDRASSRSRQQKPKEKKKFFGLFSEKEEKGTDWGETYIEMAEGCRDWAKNCLPVVAEAPGAVIFHCQTGKDRTGIMACFLLSAANVREEEIIADYCVSEIYLRPVRNQLTPYGDSFYHTPPDAMRTLIDYLKQEYGSVNNFLLDSGVGQETLTRIREKLIGENSAIS